MSEGRIRSDTIDRELLELVVESGTDARLEDIQAFFQERVDRRSARA
jgi:hypothetical protein